MNSTSKQRILVTGGASGIGRAICLRLARDGKHVLINCRTRGEAAAALVAKIKRDGGTAEVACTDVTDSVAVHSMILEQAALGGLQGLVHAASAPLQECRFTRAQWESFEQHWRVTVQGAFNLTQAFIAQAETCQPEAIVFLLSSVTLGAPPLEKSAYTAAKYALLGLARTLAVELASRRIRVNCISPGFTETPLTSHIDSRIKEMIARAVPLKRLAQGDDVAHAAAFLLSPESSYLTGVNLPVTGGAAM